MAQRSNTASRLGGFIERRPASVRSGRRAEGRGRQIRRCGRGHFCRGQRFRAPALRRSSLLFRFLQRFMDTTHGFLSLGVSGSAWRSRSAVLARVFSASRRSNRSPGSGWRHCCRLRCRVVFQIEVAHHTLNHTACHQLLLVDKGADQTLLAKQVHHSRNAVGIAMNGLQRFADKNALPVRSRRSATFRPTYALGFFPP